MTKIEQYDAEDNRVPTKRRPNIIAYYREENTAEKLWSTVDETAHQPNEYAKIENFVNDAKVFAFFDHILE